MSFMTQEEFYAFHKRDAEDPGWKKKKRYDAFWRSIEYEIIDRYDPQEENITYFRGGKNLEEAILTVNNYDPNIPKYFETQNGKIVRIHQNASMLIKRTQ